MFISTVTSNLNTISQTPMSSLFPASVTLAKAALAVTTLLLSQVSGTRADAKNKQSDENGEFYKGHYFDYYTYPHGHKDCDEGSTLFDLDIAKEAEYERQAIFLVTGKCNRGMSTISAKDLKTGALVTCNSNGMITGAVPPSKKQESRPL